MPNNTKTLEYYILNIKCSVRQQANKIPQSYNITIRHVIPNQSVVYNTYRVSYPITPLSTEEFQVSTFLLFAHYEVL